jgi:hypothetical protein
VSSKKAIPMDFGQGKVLCAAAGAPGLADQAQEGITWFAIMLAILLVAVVAMLVITRHR